MRKVLASFFVLGVLALGGCATVISESSRTEAKARPARAADYPIEVLSEAVPSRPHKVIGSVRVRVKLSESRKMVVSDAKVLAAVKSEARALGGDALLPVTVTPASGGGTYVTPGEVLAGESEIWTALVIVWLDRT